MDLDGWEVSVGNEIERGFSFLPDYYVNVAKERSLKLMDVYRQMYDGPWSFAGGYPYPNAFYGSVEELREAALRVHDNGGRMIHYINYQISIPDGPAVQRIGPTPRAFIPTNIPPPYMPAGFPPITERSYTGLPEDQFGNDRAAREWSDRDLFWAVWYAQNVAADGIFLDQLSAAFGGLQESTWNIGRITTEARKHVPDFILAGEGVGQAHGRTLAFGLASAVFHRSELYRYTFPGHLVMDGTANGALGWGGGDRRFNAIFLNGCRFDGVPDDDAFRNKLMDLRLRTKQLLYPAVFRDTEGVSLSYPPGLSPPSPMAGNQLAPWDGIQAKRFVLSNANSRVILVNTLNTPKAADARVTVETKEIGTIVAAWAFLWDGTLLQIPFDTEGNTQVVFSIPAVEQATVVLVNQCEPLLYADTAGMLPAGVPGQATMNVLNLNPELIEGTITWDLPDGWSSTAANFGAVNSGEQVTTNATLTPSSSATRQIYDFWCEATTLSGSKGRKFASISIVPNPYVKWAFMAGPALELTIENQKGESVSGSSRISFPTDSLVGTAEVEQAFAIPANSETIQTFHFTNLTALTEPIGLHILVQSGPEQQDLPIRLFPPIANGEFEVDRAGDGKPDYWTTYDYSGQASIKDTYPLIHLDTNVAHAGQSSLRIDPFADGGIHVDVLPLATLLFPNTIYSMSAYAKVPVGGALRIVTTENQDLQMKASQLPMAGRSSRVAGKPVPWRIRTQWQLLAKAQCQHGLIALP